MTIITERAGSLEPEASTERYYNYQRRAAKGRVGHFVLSPYLSGASDRAVKHLLDYNFSKFGNRVPAERRYRDPYLLFNEAEQPWSPENALSNDEAMNLASVFGGISQLSNPQLKVIRSSRTGQEIGTAVACMPFPTIVAHEDRYLMGQIMNETGVPRGTFVYHFAPYAPNSPMLEAYRVGQDVSHDPLINFATDLDPAGQPIDLPRLNLLPMFMELNHARGMEIKFPYEPMSDLDAVDASLKLEGRMGLWNSVRRPNIAEIMTHMFPGQPGFIRFLQQAQNHQLLIGLLGNDPERVAWFTKKYSMDKWGSPEAVENFEPIMTLGNGRKVTLLNAGAALASDKISTAERINLRNILTMRFYKLRNELLKDRIAFTTTPPTDEARILELEEMIYWQHAITHTPPGFQEVLAYTGATHAFNQEDHPLHAAALEHCTIPVSANSVYQRPARRMRSRYYEILRSDFILRLQVDAIDRLRLETSSPLAQRILEINDPQDLITLLVREEIEEARRVFQEEHASIAQLGATPLLAEEVEVATGDLTVREAESLETSADHPNNTAVPERGAHEERLPASAEEEPADQPVEDPAPEPLPERTFKNTAELIRFMAETVIADKQYVSLEEVLEEAWSELQDGTIYTIIPSLYYQQLPDGAPADAVSDRKAYFAMIQRGQALVVVDPEHFKGSPVRTYWNNLIKQGQGILRPADVKKLASQLAAAQVEIPEWLQPLIPVETPAAAPTASVAAPQPAHEAPASAPQPPRERIPVIEGDKKVIDAVKRIMQEKNYGTYRSVLRGPLQKLLLEGHAYTVVPADVIIRDEIAAKRHHILDQGDLETVLGYATTTSGHGFIVLNRNDMTIDDAETFWKSKVDSGLIILYPHQVRKLVREFRRTLGDDRLPRWINDFIDEDTLIEDDEMEERAVAAAPGHHHAPTAQPTHRPPEQQQALSGEALVSHIWTNVIEGRRFLSEASARSESGRSLLNRDEAYTTVASRNYRREGGADDETLDYLESLVQLGRAFIIVSDDDFRQFPDYWRRRINQGQALIATSRELQTISARINQAEEHRTQSRDVAQPPNIPRPSTQTQPRPLAPAQEQPRWRLRDIFRRRR